MPFNSIGICVILLIVANGAPVIATDIFKNHFQFPIDGGHRFFDGRPWLGHSKTWRGVIAAILTTTLVAKLFSFDWQFGILFAGLAMTGDLLASFSKRRIGISVSGRARLLDQLPESILPVLLLRDSLGLSLSDVVIVVAVFTLLDLLVSPLLYRLHIRRRPY
jgi:CDP-2,3-bis-(O-geranylgeranyl)-sn-glycerol synthase